MKLMIDIPKRAYDMTKEMGNVIDADNEVVAEAIRNGTPIPDNATNSDIMLTMFPDETDLHTFARHNKVTWWNSPYQKGGKE